MDSTDKKKKQSEESNDFGSIIKNNEKFKRKRNNTFLFFGTGSQIEKETEKSAHTFGTGRQKEKIGQIHKLEGKEVEKERSEQKYCKFNYTPQLVSKGAKIEEGS